MSSETNGFYQAMEYRERTGLCVICGKKPAVRMTCGHIACIERWLGMKSVGSNSECIPVQLEPTEVEWAERIAKGRYAVKQGHEGIRDKRHMAQDTGKPRWDNYETHRIGVLGELAAAKVLRAKINTDFVLTGIDLPDIVIAGVKIEVKTLQGYLCFRDDNEFRRGIAVLVNHDKGRNLVVQGWIDAPTFHQVKFTFNFGYGDRPCVHPRDLFPIKILRTELEKGLRK